VRELKDNPYVENASKNPNWANGKWMHFIPNEGSSPTKGNNLNPMLGDEEKSGADPEDIKVELEEK
jgi:hypothetical protein